MHKLFTNQEMKALKADFNKAQTLAKQSASLLSWDEYLRQMLQIKNTNPEAFNILISETVSAA